MPPWRAILPLLKGFQRLASVNMSNSREEDAARVKKELIDTVATLALGLDPESVQGFVKTTGTETNRAAIDYARRKTGKEIVVCSSLSHRSVLSAAKDKVRVVPVSAQDFQMNVSELLDALNKETGVLVITAGTTELGMIESLPPEVEQKCRELGIWIHIDAAYGGMNLGMLGEDHSQSQAVRRLAQAQGVSSVMVDAHKFVGPGECSLLFLKSNARSDESMYIPGATEISGTTKGSLIPYLTLETIKTFGPKGLQERAIQTYRSAEYFGQCLKQHGIKTVIPVQSGIVPIRLSSQEEALFLHRELQNAGFILADPLQLKTAEGVVHGIRLVFTPDVYFDSPFLGDLARIVAFVIKQK